MILMDFLLVNRPGGGQGASFVLMFNEIIAETYYCFAEWGMQIKQKYVEFFHILKPESVTVWSPCKYNRTQMSWPGRPISDV